MRTSSTNGQRLRSTPFSMFFSIILETPTHSRDPSNTTLYRPSSVDEGLELEPRRTSERDGVSHCIGRASPELELAPMDEDEARADPRFRDGARTPPPTPKEMKFLTEGDGTDLRKLGTKEYWKSKEAIRKCSPHCIDVNA